MATQPFSASMASPLQIADAMHSQQGSFLPSLSSRVTGPDLQWASSPAEASTFPGPAFVRGKTPEADADLRSRPRQDQQQQQLPHLMATSSQPEVTVQPAGIAAAVGNVTEEDSGEVPRRKSKNWTKASIAMQAMRRFVRAGEQGRARKAP